MSSSAQDSFRLGFLSAVEDDDRGIVGGLLVTNRFGRPLEFQCTTPVKPNRTQQILYGPTLRPFLMTEVVGKTLVEKIGVKPHLVLVEGIDQLELRAFVSLPVASLIPATESGTPAEGQTVLGKQWLEFHRHYQSDAEVVRAGASEVPDTADLKEPFERIREALNETLKTAVARSA